MVLKDYLISQFNKFSKIGTLKSEAYEYFALVNNSNWMMLMYTNGIFSKSSCRSHMFELLDELSFGRRLSSGGTSSNYYYRQYILFYAIVMRLDPAKTPPRPKSAKSFNFTGLQPMPDNVIVTLRSASDIVYANDFVGMLE